MGTYNSKNDLPLVKKSEIAFSSYFQVSKPLFWHKNQIFHSTPKNYSLLPFHLVYCSIVCNQIREADWPQCEVSMYCCVQQTSEQTEFKEVILDHQFFYSLARDITSITIKCLHDKKDSKFVDSLYLHTYLHYGQHCTHRHSIVTD